MSQDNVSKIKERLGIKEVVEIYVKLEKAGSNFKGRCPFHNEKTPSFFVSPDRDSYYCFGCGAKGDIFTFVQEYEGLDFLGSLKMLADKAGIKLEKVNFQQSKENNLLKDILEETTKYFEECFSKNKEVDIYLKGRGLTDETIKEWRIGFAPSGWDKLITYLKEKNYKEEYIEKAGLIKKGEKEGYYDRFRSRIIFPIFNSNGEVVAFTGRIFGQEEDTAKYLNSPETELFKKSQILYGFDKAKQSIRKNNFSILVEGQMDTIMAHQAGYKNAVASSGTAITEIQLQNLNKLSNNLVIAYDSDSAGFNASEKAWRTALSIGMDVKISPIKEGFDPADLIKEDIDSWKKTIKDSKHIIEVLINRINNSETDKRKINQRIVKEIVPHLKAIRKGVDRHYFIKKVSEGFDIPMDIINTEIENYSGSEVEDKIDSDSVVKRERDEFALEKRLFGIMYVFEKKDEDKFAEIQQGIINIVSQDGYDKILESINEDLEEIIFAVESSFEQQEAYKESAELLKNLKSKKLNTERRGLLLELKKAEQNQDENLSNELLEKINNISKEIQSIN
jgi:DNA primase